MRLLLPVPIDGRREVSLEVIPPPGQARKDWEDAITPTFELYEGFIWTGGLGAHAERVWKPGEPEWRGDAFFYKWPSYPFRAVGLAVLLRMLSRITIVDGSLIASIILSGTPSTPDHPLAIAGLEAAMDSLPKRVPHLPFDLEICPYGTWVNVECSLPDGFPPEVPLALDNGMRAWGRIADGGGFQIGVDQKVSFGVGFEGPTIAEDFVEWHCLMSGVPVESLNGMLNVLAFFSERTFPIKSVYIG